MADTLTPMFAIGKYKNIEPLILSGGLTYPAYICCRDTNTAHFVDKDGTLHDLGYVTESWLKEQGYLTKEDVQAIVGECIDSLFN